MTPLHDEHAVVVALSNAWFDRDRELWYVGLELSKCLDRTLLACIYQRLREVRDDVAREAFARQLSIGEVARERLAELRAAPNESQTKQQTQHHRELSNGEELSDSVVLSAHRGGNEVDHDGLLGG